MIDTDLDNLDPALAEAVKTVRRQILHYDPRDPNLTIVFSNANWAPLDMPRWFLVKEERESVWPNQKMFICAGGWGF